MNKKTEHRQDDKPSLEECLRIADRVEAGLKARGIRPENLSLKIGKDRGYFGKYFRELRKQGIRRTLPPSVAVVTALHLMMPVHDLLPSQSQPQFPNHLGAWRKRRRLSLGELSRRTDLDARFIEAVENGEYMPRQAAIERLCDALDITEPELFYVDPVKHKALVDSLDKDNSGRSRLDIVRHVLAFSGFEL